MIRKSEMSPIKTKLQKLRKKAFEISRVLLVLLEDEDIFSRLFLNNLSFSLEGGEGGTSRLNSRASLDIGGTGVLRKSFGSALVKLRNEFNAAYQNGAFPPAFSGDDYDEEPAGYDKHHSPHSAEHHSNSVKMDDFAVGGSAYALHLLYVVNYFPLQVIPFTPLLGLSPLPPPLPLSQLLLL